MKTQLIRDSTLSPSGNLIKITLLTWVPLPEPGGPKSTAFIPTGSSISLGNGCTRDGIVQ
jgi:hypothetical protein